MAEVLDFLARTASRNPALHATLAASLALVASALHAYGGAGELALSFNGGKDSTVVLHLLRAALLARARAAEGAGAGGAARAPGAADAGAAAGAAAAAAAAAPGAPAPAGSLGGVRVVFFSGAAGARDFPEVAAFMAEAERAHGFRVEVLGDFAGGLAALVAGGVRGVLMGTRRGDPDAAALAGPFAPTTPGWPPAVRVCPILSWAYADVWALLRGARLPACALYARGFTSLGAAATSAPNPALAVGDGGDACACAGPARACGCAAAAARGEAFLPAWDLADGALERAGRRRAGAA